MKGSQIYIGSFITDEKIGMIFNDIESEFFEYFTTINTISATT